MTTQSVARATLGVFLGGPPVFHDESEVALVEDRRRTGPASVMCFAANVHSALSSKSASGGQVRTLKFEPVSGTPGKLRPGLSSWWDEPDAGGTMLS